MNTLLKSMIVGTGLWAGVASAQTAAPAAPKTNTINGQPATEAQQKEIKDSVAAISKCLMVNAPKDTQVLVSEIYIQPENKFQLVNYAVVKSGANVGIQPCDGQKVVNEANSHVAKYLAPVQGVQYVGYMIRSSVDGQQSFARLITLEEIQKAQAAAKGQSSAASDAAKAAAKAATEAQPAKAKK